MIADLAPVGSSRPFCLKCLRSERSCLCERIQPFSTSVDFVILMHEMEWRRRLTTGTGLLTHLCLRNSQLAVGVDFGKEPKVLQVLENSHLFPCLLFPGEDAQLVSKPQVARSLVTAADGKRIVVFLIDATWSCAKKILRLNPFLQELPKLSFSTERLSEYRFKRQPRSECLSTIESVHEFLGTLCGTELAIARPEHLAHLMDLFRRHVDFQDGFSPGSALPSTLANKTSF